MQIHIQPDWCAHHAAAAAWRGHAQEAFARAERAITETLLTLAADGSKDPALPHLVGQRSATLADLLKAKHPAAVKPLSALEAFRRHDRLRTLLCHGTGTLLVDRRGDWHFRLDAITLRGGKATPETAIFSQSDAATLLRSVRTESQRLADRLQVFREALVV